MEFIKNNLPYFHCFTSYKKAVIATQEAICTFQQADNQAKRLLKLGRLLRASQ